MKSLYPIVLLGKHIEQVSLRNKKNINVDVFSVTNSEGFIQSTEYFSKQVFSKDISNYKIVQHGQFAYNPSRINVGSIDFLHTNKYALVSPLYVVFKLNDDINNKFLLLYLKSAWGNSQIRDNTEGAVRDSLKYSGLEKIKIPLPPLDDQKRIAHLLDTVDGLISERKRHLQQLDALLQSVFMQMFGDPVRNEKKFKLVRLEKFIIHLTSGGRNWTKYAAEAGKRFIRSFDVQMNAISNEVPAYVIPPNNKESLRTRVADGDVLLTITGSRIGRVCVVPSGFEEAYVSQHVAIIRTQKINATYLSFYLSMPNCGQKIIARKQYGQTKPGLSLAQINEFIVLDAPLPLQNQFATILEKVESIKQHYQHSLSQLENLYGVLSQKAFKGELDLSRVHFSDDEHQEKIMKKDSKESTALPAEVVTDDKSSDTATFSETAESTLGPELGAIAYNVFKAVPTPLKFLIGAFAVGWGIKKLLESGQEIAPTTQLSLEKLSEHPKKSEQNKIDVLKNRREIINFFFKEYVDEKKDTGIDVNLFTQSVQQRLIELADDEQKGLVWSIEGYEQIKQMVFDDVRGGSLVQEFNAETNTICLKKARAV